jgi:hypothetical protein
MAENNGKYIGNTPVKEDARVPLHLKLKDKSVQQKHLSDEVKNRIDKVDDLQNQIDSIQIHGMAVATKFGNDTNIGISQKTLTDAINRIWDAIDAITGEVSRGIRLTVDPVYYIG